MTGGIIMQVIRYGKPNMNNLKGKKGRAVLAEIRSMKAPSTEEIRREADVYMKQILAKRKNAK